MLMSRPTVNIEGLVGGYTGQGGKTILPHRAVAKIDLRLVPDMTAAEALGRIEGASGEAGFRRYRGQHDRRIRPEQHVSGCAASSRSNSHSTSERASIRSYCLAVQVRGPATSSPARHSIFLPVDSVSDTATVPTHRTNIS